MKKNSRTKSKRNLSKLRQKTYKFQFLYWKLKTIRIKTKKNQVRRKLFIIKFMNKFMKTFVPENRKRQLLFFFSGIGKGRRSKITFKVKRFLRKKHKVKLGKKSPFSRVKPKFRRKSRKKRKLTPLLLQRHRSITKLNTTKTKKLSFTNKKYWFKSSISYLSLRRNLHLSLRQMFRIKFYGKYYKRYGIYELKRIKRLHRRRSLSKKRKKKKKKLNWSHFVRPLRRIRRILNNRILPRNKPMIRFTAPRGLTYPSVRGWWRKNLKRQVKYRRYLQNRNSYYKFVARVKTRRRQYRKKIKKWKNLYYIYQRQLHIRKPPDELFMQVLHKKLIKTKISFLNIDLFNIKKSFYKINKLRDKIKGFKLYKWNYSFKPGHHKLSRITPKDILLNKKIISYFSPNKHEPKSEQQKNDILDYLKNKYAYYEYIGKNKVILRRVKSNYIWNFQQYPYKTKIIAFNDMFSYEQLQKTTITTPSEEFHNRLNKVKALLCYFMSKQMYKKHIHTLERIPFFRRLFRKHFMVRRFLLGTIFILKKRRNTFVSIFANDPLGPKRLIFKASLGIIKYKGPKRKSDQGPEELAKFTSKALPSLQLTAFDLIFLKPIRWSYKNILRALTYRHIYIRNFIGYRKIAFGHPRPQKKPRK